MNVPSTPSDDPNDPEHLQRALARERHVIIRRQLGLAAVGYALTITLLALFPGLIFDPDVLLLYFGSSLVVALTVLLDWTGSFSAPFLQGIIGLALVLVYGPLQPFIFFMFLAHVTVPGLFWHWTEMIHDANR